MSRQYYINENTRQSYFTCYSRGHRGCHVSLCVYNGYGGYDVVLTADDLYKKTHYLFNDTDPTENLTRYQVNKLWKYLCDLKTNKRVSKNMLLFLINTVINCREDDQQRYYGDLMIRQSILYQELAEINRLHRNSIKRHDEESENRHQREYINKQRQINTFSKSQQMINYTNHHHQIMFYKWLGRSFRKIKINNNDCWR